MSDPTAPIVTRVKSAKRSADFKAKWADPTVGPDGLTYRQRMTKVAADARAAQLARKRGASGQPTAGPPPPQPGNAPVPKAERGRGIRRWTRRRTP